MRWHFAKRPLQRRIIALVAAYTIALSSLIASFGAARAAAEAPALPGGIICHTDSAEQPSRSSDDVNGKICAACCSAGCLMPMAAVPPPPTTAITAPQASSRTIAPRDIAGLAGGRETKSHRSRAPPLAA